MVERSRVSAICAGIDGASGKGGVSGLGVEAGV